MTCLLPGPLAQLYVGFSHIKEGDTGRHRVGRPRRAMAAVTSRGILQEVQPDDLEGLVLRFGDLSPYCSYRVKCQAPKNGLINK